MKSEQEVRELLAKVQEIEEELGSESRAASRLNVSRNAVRKWKQRINVPKEANVRQIELVLAEVRRRATKVTEGASPSLVKPEPAGLASDPLRVLSVDALKELGPMGATLARIVTNEEPTYLLELEICLWYHRDEVSDGVISQTVITAAKEGAFEEDGCATWQAHTWWVELQARDKRLRESMRLKIRDPRRRGGDKN